jgi:hypothetical protein
MRRGNFLGILGCAVATWPFYPPVRSSPTAMPQALNARACRVKLLKPIVIQLLAESSKDRRESVNTRAKVVVVDVE